MAKVMGLEGVVAAETEIGHVNGEAGHLIYKGYWAKDLAISYSFEEVAYLLWYGELPDAARLQEFKSKLASYRYLTPELKSLIDVIPKHTPMMNVMMSAVSSLAGEQPSWPPTVEQAMQIAAIVPMIIAYRHHSMNGTRWPQEFEQSDRDHVSHYLHMLFGRPVSDAHVRAMNAYMVLAMEHGLNASTFTARVVSSTESDLYSAISAAIAAMKGPLHGGAPSEVITLLDDIGSKENAEPYMRSLLDNGKRLMGFGHRIYKTRDPRAEALRKVTSVLAGDDSWFDLANHVEETAIRLLAEYKPGRNLYTNVEFYAAAVMRSIQMPSVLFSPTFSAARIIGWTAHVLEQSHHNRIIRPQSEYVGVIPQEF